MRAPQTALLLTAVLASAFPVLADSTINPVNANAWSGNLGWINCRGDALHGAVVGESVCSGHLYSANAGWINLGSGAPANGIRYLNNSATDFGVNRNDTGELSGLAWGANIGWLLFTNRDLSGRTYEGPRVDLLTGAMSGYVFSANTGWISLSNAVAFVQTDRIEPGADSDRDGVADAFEYFWTGGLTTMNATTDFDQDGSSDLEEYLADTNPSDPNQHLRVTSFTTSPGGTNAVITWTTSPSRFYTVQQRANLGTNDVWIDSGLGLISPGTGPTTTRAVADAPASQRFLRVEAVLPLSR